MIISFYGHIHFVDWNTNTSFAKNANLGILVGIGGIMILTKVSIRCQSHVIGFHKLNVFLLFLVLCIFYANSTEYDVHIFNDIVYQF